MRGRRRSVARSVRLAFASLALLAAGWAPAAHAARARPPADSGLRRLAVAPQGIQAVAYAGETRLYVDGETLMRVVPGSRPVRVARLPGAAVQIASSPTRVAVIVQRGTTERVLAGPPVGPLRTLASCRGRSEALPDSALAVAGDLVAEALSCPAHGLPEGAAAVRVHDGGAVRVEPAPPGRLVVALAGAPGVLATATRPADDLEGPVRIDVRDIATDALLESEEPGDGPEILPAFAVQSDGTVVFCGARDRLAWASPSAPAPTPLAGVRCPMFDDVALANGAIAYVDRGIALRTTELASGRTRTLVPGAPLGWTFAWNGSAALFDAPACGDDFLDELGAHAGPYRASSCIVRVVAVRQERRRHAVAVTLACPAGCRGSMWLDGPFDAVSATRSFHHRRGGRVTVRLVPPPRARRMLRTYRSLPFVVEISYVDARDFGGAPVIDRDVQLAGEGRRRYVPPPPSPEP